VQNGQSVEDVLKKASDKIDEILKAEK